MLKFLASNADNEGIKDAACGIIVQSDSVIETKEDALKITELIEKITDSVIESMAGEVVSQTNDEIRKYYLRFLDILSKIAKDKGIIDKFIKVTFAMIPKNNVIEKADQLYNKIFGAINIPYISIEEQEKYLTIKKYFKECVYDKGENILEHIQKIINHAVDTRSTTIIKGVVPPMIKTLKTSLKTKLSDTEESIGLKLAEVDVNILLEYINENFDVIKIGVENGENPLLMHSIDSLHMKVAASKILGYYPNECIVSMAHNFEYNNPVIKYTDLQKKLASQYGNTAVFRLLELGEQFATCTQDKVELQNILASENALEQAVILLGLDEISV